MSGNNHKQHTLKKLAVVTTHPIQYYAPVFKLLHQRGNLEIRVFYTLGDQSNKHDPGFNKVVEWDIPLLEGYDYTWVDNISKNAGSDHFGGIINPGLIEQVIDWSADAILVFGWSYQSHLRALRYFKNKMPVFFRGDSTLLDEKKGARSLLKSLFLHWVYAHADHAFYVGTNNKAYFKKYGLKEGQLSFAPHAVDNERFAANTTAPAVRSEIGIGEDGILVLFAGKLSVKKAPMLLLEAFLSISDCNAHLLFVGNGELEAALKARAKNSLNVHFFDFQNQSAMPGIYGSCDLFCLPSAGPGESWGLAVNEAMACGKAVLASDKVGCAADLVKNGFNGAIFNAGNSADLSKKLRELMSNKQQLATYGDHSKNSIKDWSFLRIATAIEEKIAAI